MENTNTANAPTGAAPQNLLLAAFAFLVGFVTDYISLHPTDPPYFTAPGGARNRLLLLERDGRAVVQARNEETVRDWKLQPDELSQCAIYVAGALGQKVELPVWYATPGETRAAAAAGNIWGDAATAGMPPHYGETQQV